MRGSTVVHFGQLRAAVARLRVMCVGMASVGQRHTEGAGGAGGVKARAMGVGLPIRTFKIIAHAIYHSIDGTTRTSSRQHDVSVLDLANGRLAFDFKGAILSFREYFSIRRERSSLIDMI